MKIDLVTTQAEFARLGPEWSELVAASETDTPFLQWEWCSTWWRHYGEGHGLAIVRVRDGGELIGLAPLYIERGSTRPSRGVMKFLGTGEVCSEYLSFLLRRGSEEPAARGILDFVFRVPELRWRQLRLTHVPETCPAATAVQAFLAASHRPFRVAHGAASWAMDLAETWEGFLAGLSRNRREKFRRARRDMEKHRLEFHEVVHEQDLDAAWHDLVRLHQARWSQAGEQGCFASPRFKAFHMELLRPLWRRGMISLTSLRHGDQAVAASYCLRHRGYVYFYQAGVDPEWLHCRPGHCLRACDMRRAIERGDRVFDFLSGDEEYKTQWATRQTTMVDLVIAGRGMLPRVRLGLESASSWAKESARANLSPDAWAALRRWKRQLTPGSAAARPNLVAAEELVTV